MEYHCVLMGEEYFSPMDKNSALHSRLLVRPIDKPNTLQTDIWIHDILALFQSSAYLRL